MSFQTVYSYRVEKSATGSFRQPMTGFHSSYDMAVKEAYQLGLTEESVYTYKSEEYIDDQQEPFPDWWI